MQNERIENSTCSLKIEKEIASPRAEVFRAIGEGKLFLNCGASVAELRIDFKTGGHYQLQFVNHGASNHGEFLEIIDQEKIVFTWCQDYSANATPDTKVSIVLRDIGGKTHLTLTHEGFTDLETKDAHQGGWNAGLTDLSGEIVNGTLRMIRSFSKKVERLFEICKNPKQFFALPGLVQEEESVANQKLVFSWHPTDSESTPPTKVTLIFETDDDDADQAWIELRHEGLHSDASQKTRRSEWERKLATLASS